MKPKFEANVASEIPKTKSSEEPNLPWKVTDEEIEKIESEKDEYKSVTTAAPPLKTRAIFLVMLVITIFFTTLCVVANVAVENERMHLNVQNEEKAVLSLKADLEKVKGEKDLLSESSAQLEKRIGDLNAQKELYTTVIETLTQKVEEPASGKKSN